MFLKIQKNWIRSKLKDVFKSICFHADGKISKSILVEMQHTFETICWKNIYFYLLKLSVKSLLKAPIKAKKSSLLYQQKTR